MGQSISMFTQDDTQTQVFVQRMQQQLEQLDEVVNRPEFGSDALMMGAELEYYLVDEQANPAPENEQILNALNDDMFQPEINRYNLELNLDPLPFSGAPFSALAQALQTKTAELNQVASPLGVNAVAVGILPTLRQADFDLTNMTNNARYHMLSQRLQQHRGEPFFIAINGADPIRFSAEHVTPEGANTSFQVHMMIEPERFVDVFNAAQLTLPLVTAVAANSPILMGHRLWDETRIALFKKSLDCRVPQQVSWQEPTRVNFGYGWLRHSPCELFAEAVALYPPLLPVLAEQPDMSGSGLPKLSELRTHMGTLWPWHRPVYSADGRGHIRMEFRAIPAGPTPADMAANAAFAIGLARGLADEVNQILRLMPFRFAEYNFYRAAESGLDAKVLWPLDNLHKPEEVSVRAVLQNMFTTAKKGLICMGVDEDEAERHLAVIKHRVATGINGATWQKRTLEHYQQSMDCDHACTQMTKDYVQNCKTELPVSHWTRPWM